MPTIDLGPPRPTPHDLLDGLPRRVALTLPELRFVAERAGGAPLPFDVRDTESAHSGSGLGARLGRSPSSTDQAAYAEALAVLRDPTESLSQRGLLVGGPDGVVDKGIIGAVGLLATPTVAVDFDVTAGGVQARAWHRQSGGAVAALSTHDALVFELAWFPTWAWSGELSRIAVIPEDLRLTDSAVPDRVDLPHELADAALEAARTHRADLLPVLVSRHEGSVTDAEGHPLHDSETTTLLAALASESRGRLRAMVAEVDQDQTTSVGVVAWTLVADGWRALRPHERDDRLYLDVARVIPEDLAGELAPVLAEVSRQQGGPRAGEAS